MTKNGRFSPHSPKHDWNSVHGSIISRKWELVVVFLFYLIKHHFTVAFNLFVFVVYMEQSDLSKFCPSKEFFNITVILHILLWIFVQLPVLSRTFYLTSQRNICARWRHSQHTSILRPVYVFNWQVSGFAVLVYGECCIMDREETQQPSIQEGNEAHL